MVLLQYTCHFSTLRFFCLHPSSPTPLRRRSFTVRSTSLPFPKHKATYHRELEAAVDVVERACRLCIDVKKSLFSDEGRVLDKNDQTPVTVADFGVQALVSLELSKLFPSIPLVAEEDSAILRSNNLVDSVASAVADNATSGFGDEPLTHSDVLEAIDRGGKDAVVFCTKPATYWVLDPIDGTRGFLRGSEALYVVGLALVVEGEIVLGVMGCPNWLEDKPCTSTTSMQEYESNQAGSGIIMVSHVGCGTWTKKLSNSQTWESLPLSALFNAKNDADNIGDDEILLVPTCCGSLCKYLMVATGRASVFILRARAQTIIKAWDHAVGIICVHEAGGKVTDWRGSPIDLDADQAERRAIFPSGGVLVTNDNLHHQIVEMISSRSSIF
ncbi:putative PAP-specific phosphatase [Citrus sinensis]|uniref:PAP-specific phosphatase n=1 Tax=Citrus sinensis TaxID=2711 RepID=A0ACB8NFY4_CITSI|nr:putative PAP-specific phosphatase [Citrus sinensis]